MKAHMTGGQKAMLRARPMLTDGEGRRLQKFSSGKVAQALLWSLKVTFLNNLDSVSAKRTTGHPHYRKEIHLWVRHSGQRSPLKEMISAYECVFSSPLTLEALGKPNCFSVTKINT